MNKQIDALKKSAESRRNQVLERALNTLEYMQTNNIPINFQSVTKLANVSKPYWV